MTPTTIEDTSFDNTVCEAMIEPHVVSVMCDCPSCEEHYDRIEDEENAKYEACTGDGVGNCGCSLCSPLDHA